MKSSDSSTIPRLVVALFATSIMWTALSAAQGDKQPHRASAQEESYMFGRVLSAVEDLGGGYNKEARHKYAAIVHDLSNREYSARLRFMAYDGFGQSLTALGEKEKAVQALTRAVEAAQALDEKERRAAAEHLEKAQSLK